MEGILFVYQKGPLCNMKTHYTQECIMKIIEKDKVEDYYLSDEVMEKYNENVPRGSLTARIISTTQVYKEYL